MTDRTKTQGLLALSPLIVFLGIYLISSIVAGDFYKIPIASAFLIASAYGLLISKKGPIEDKISVFSQGAGQKNVLLMLWIFILATRRDEHLIHPLITRIVHYTIVVCNYRYATYSHTLHVCIQ